MQCDGELKWIQQERSLLEGLCNRFGWPVREVQELKQKVTEQQCPVCKLEVSVKSFETHVRYCELKRLVPNPQHTVWKNSFLFFSLHST
jgi:hypothetical protein